MNRIDGLNDERLPMKEGVYLLKDGRKIDVYYHPIKGLCCFSEDFGSAGAGVNDETDCHVSVQNTGLEFVVRIGDLK